MEVAINGKLFFELLVDPTAPPTTPHYHNMAFYAYFFLDLYMQTDLVGYKGLV